jgi:DNA-binding CsgD family transcriptional regulator
VTAKVGVESLEIVGPLFDRPVPANSASRAASIDVAQLGLLGHVLAAVESVLDTFVTPAYLVSRSGDVMLSNAAASALHLLERERLERSLAATMQRDASESAWELVRLDRRNGCGGLIAVLRGPIGHDTDLDDLAAVRARWKLTGRQNEVLDLVLLGYTNAYIGEKLGIQECTVEFHLSAIFDKAGVNNRATLIGRLVSDDVSRSGPRVAAAPSRPNRRR